MWPLCPVLRAQGPLAFHARGMTAEAGRPSSYWVCFRPISAREVPDLPAGETVAVTDI
jgi:hypothetical protein